MNKAEFLEKLERERSEWDEALSLIPKEGMADPGTEGNWSIKDVIAHVTWFEREMAILLQTRALAGSELWGLSRDERNEVIYQENRTRSLEDVLRESQEVFREVSHAFESVNDADLNDPHRIAGMPEDWLPWQIIASNTYEHYRDHKPSIR